MLGVTRGARMRQRIYVHEMSLEAAYEEWSTDLVRYASFLVASADAADLVADAFADLIASPDGAWRSARNPKGFLFGVVANVAKEHHRSSSRRQARLERVAQQVGAGAKHGIEMELDDPAIQQGLDALSVQQRVVIHLTYWHDVSVSDVADVLGVSSGTVRKQLARARAHLRKVL